MHLRPMSMRTDDVVVVGSGMAGLVCALALAPRSVTLLTKTLQLEGGSSLWAKGGIAAAIGADDTPENHASDTVAAGAGLSNLDRARDLADDGVDSLQWLIAQGAPFDRALDGTLALAKEAAHSVPRVIHAGGDATGRVLMKWLVERVRATSSITVLQETLAHDLIVSDDRVRGLLAFHPSRGWTEHRTPHIVLATGGIGMTWWHTTNPPETTGDGLAMAARVGANLVDMEFMQFHPTALMVGKQANGESLVLLTEALRGAGALLIDEQGYRFMQTEHPAAEMAPRDVVARAIEKHTEAGKGVYLDLRPVIAVAGRGSFPQAMEAILEAGYNPENEPVPVAPAAHYLMGGIQTDHRGRTSIDGLWACGEVASTGIHGANRLASNSLLEALVYARRVAMDIQEKSTPSIARCDVRYSAPSIPPESVRAEIVSIIKTTRILMSRHVGVVRTDSGLLSALSELKKLHAELHDLNARRSPKNTDWKKAPSAESVLHWCQARNRVLVANLVTLAALQRDESRGAHFRHDHPVAKSEWRRHQIISLDGGGEWPHMVTTYRVAGY